MQSNFFDRDQRDTTKSNHQWCWKQRHFKLSTTHLMFSWPIIYHLQPHANYVVSLREHVDFNEKIKNCDKKAYKPMK